MSSSGLIYAVIVGAWAAYLVPMWLRRQDELNEARPTERFSTAIRLLSGRAGMERRYAKDLRARSTEEGEPSAVVPDAVTDSVDVRAFAMPPARPQVHAQVRRPGPDRSEATREPEREAAREPAREPGREPARDQARDQGRGQVRDQARDQAAKPAPQQAAVPAPSSAQASKSAPKSAPASARKRVPVGRRTPAEEAAAARARRVKVLARRRRTTVMLFLAFTLGAIVAAVGGLALLWAPGVPAVLLSGYIAYLRSQERSRFAYQMDRRQAEAAAQRLRERQPRRRATVDAGIDDAEEGPEPETDPGMSALAADRRALVEQTDHAEWVDQQRERQRRPGQGDSWDPVPVPLPTYVTAPVAPRATSDVDLGAPDAWSSARSSAVAPEQEAQPTARDEEAEDLSDDDKATPDGRTDARRAASARRARERGRTPLFDQYEDGERPRAANE
ncbi:gephyrin-like molybdotransferase receptor GlpR [Streptomyces sp. STR69]|uniref:divisome protein SepX/GlpR n=1 Tax=Streptomyces sp. STR69 TaxID=1796942 RepID=UPI0021C735A8|nr:gephyrin-like molybdotransferase receptor GlpR [Streptomyces sp. STR69]